MLVLTGGVGHHGLNVWISVLKLLLVEMLDAGHEALVLLLRLHVWWG